MRLTSAPVVATTTAAPSLSKEELICPGGCDLRRGECRSCRGQRQYRELREPGQPGRRPLHRDGRQPAGAGHARRRRRLRRGDVGRRRSCPGRERRQAGRRAGRQRRAQHRPDRGHFGDRRLPDGGGVLRIYRLQPGAERHGHRAGDYDSVGNGDCSDDDPDHPQHDSGHPGARSQHRRCRRWDGRGAPAPAARPAVGPAGGGTTGGSSGGIGPG